MKLVVKSKVRAGFRGEGLNHSSRKLVVKSQVRSGGVQINHAASKAR